MRGKRILLIVTGGIAAYKAAFLVRLLRRCGSEIRVVMSEAATEFVTPLTFEVLSGNPVPRDLFAQRSEPGIEHVELAGWAERVIVAPATADCLCKAAHGAADDLASTVLAAVRCPVYFAPAMNTGMWENPAVKRNIEMLRQDGRLFIEPGEGELACGDTGPGRMAEPEEIIEVLARSYAPGAFAGVHVLVTAGRTEEAIDTVRYLSNRSSGRMGFAIARAAREMGARVSLIHGPVDLPPPHVDSVTRVASAADMKRAVTKVFPRVDVLIMAAAVADFTPARTKTDKIKRGSENLSIDLRPTADILASLKGRKRKGQVVVGFALETEAGESNARSKIMAKGCDYMVLNRVGEKTGFGVSTNRITLFKGMRKMFASDLVSKDEAARLILQRIISDKKTGRASR